MTLQEVADEVGTVATAYVGYAPDKAHPPYVVVRPITRLTDGVSVAGKALAYTSAIGAYCVADSVEASYNLAVLVMGALSGEVDMNYTGEQVAHRYESLVQVTSLEGSAL